VPPLETSRPADRQLDERIERPLERQIVAGHADDHAAENVDGRDDQASDGIAANEFRRTVHGAEELAFFFEFAAAADRFLFIDGAGRKIGVDRHLLAGQRVERKPRADFRDTRRALGDDDKIDGDENDEDDDADDEIAAHHKLGEARDDMTCRRRTLRALRKNEARRRHVERKA